MIEIVEAFGFIGQLNDLQISSAHASASNLSAVQGRLAIGELNILRGAVLGSLFAGLAFLAGFAVIKKSSLSFSTALMVGSAALLELFWLNFLQTPSQNLVVLLQGLFGASVIIFLSSTVSITRNHSGFGGLMLAASLVLIGVGVINFLGRADLSGMMLRSLFGVGVFAFVLSVVQSIRGDRGAQMILPGTLLTMTALVVIVRMGAGGLLAHGLFALGILAASLVSITERRKHFDGGLGHQGELDRNPLGTASFGAAALAGGVAAGSGFKPTEAQSAPEGQPFNNQEAVSNRAGSPDTKFSGPSSEAVSKAGPVGGRKPAMSSDRLLEVLDFSGIAVWDWSLDGVYQSDSLCVLLGADCEADFTPEAMRAFISPSHLSIFEEDVLGHGSDDGGFDTTICIHNGHVMRVRGARAIDKNGRLERVVAFFENPMSSPASIASQNQKTASGLQNSIPVNPSFSKTDEDHVAAAYSPAVPVPDFHDDPCDDMDFSKSLGLNDNNSGVDNQKKAQDISTPALALSAENLSVSKASNIASDISEELAIEYHPLIAFGTGEIVGYRADIPSSLVEQPASKVMSKMIEHGAQLLESEHQRNQKAIKNPSTNERKVSSDAFIALRTSWAQLNEDGFFETIHNAIRKYALPYGSLVLEMDGLSAIKDMRSAKATFAQIRQAGARVAFADGNASNKVLGNLHRYDFDYISLSEPVVSKLGKSNNLDRYTRALMTLGRDLGLRILASGVSDQGLVMKLRNYGCHHGDGDALANSAVFQAPVNGQNKDDNLAETHETAPSADLAMNEVSQDAENEEANHNASKVEELDRTLTAKTNSPLRDENGAISLDSWSFDGNKRDTTDTAFSQSTTDKSLNAIPSIRAAFAESVPSFSPGASQANGQSGGLEEMPGDSITERSLPKWRTWGKQMR